MGEVIATLGFVVSGGMYVMVTDEVPLLPAASVAVTVIVFDPAERAMPPADHDVVPLQAPLPPRLLDQVTEVIPDASPAVPLMLTVPEVVVEPCAGLVILTAGEIESTA